jgi:TetR/AcrR family transcriptional repressor of nem operon
MSTPAGTTAGPDLTAKGRRTREHIVTTAARLVHDHGATATTLTDVRTAAGVSSSQLYHYFSDKQDLVHAVIEYQADDVVKNQRSMNLSTLDAFRQWRLDLLTDTQMRHGQGGCPLGSLGADLAETDPLGRERVAAGFRRWAHVIETGLATMRQNHELPRDTDVHRLAVGILATLQGGLLLDQIERSTDALDAALENVITLLEAMTGIAKVH